MPAVNAPVASPLTSAGIACAASSSPESSSRGFVAGVLVFLLPLCALVLSVLHGPCPFAHPFICAFLGVLSLVPISSEHDPRVRFLRDLS